MELHREKLAKTLGMMGSAHDGERAAAALKADQMVKSAGMTWAAIVVPQIAAAPRPAPPPPPTWNYALSPSDLMMRYGDVLSDWEFQFLESLLRWRRDFTPKQTATLNKILPRFA